MLSITFQIAPHHVAAIACLVLGLVITIALALGDSHAKE